MGRTKLNMELMINEKARCRTFNKRKDGLKRKARELSTLCDVQVCVILYGPKQADGCPIAPEIFIYPKESPNEIQNLITSYKTLSAEDRSKRSFNLSSFFEDRKRKVEDALVKLRKKNDEAKYPTWDDRFNSYSEENLREIVGRLESKLEAVRSRFELLRQNQICKQSSMINISHARPTENNSYPMPGLFRRKSIDSECFHPQPISSVNSRDVNFNLPIQYQLDQIHHGLPLDSNLVPNPMMMMMLMNNNDCTQHEAASSSNVQYTPLNGPVYYDPISGMLENMMVKVNNPRPPMCYYDLPMQQMAPQGTHYTMMSGASSQMHASQIGDYHEVCDLQMKK